MGPEIGNKRPRSSYTAAAGDSGGSQDMLENIYFIRRASTVEFHDRAPRSVDGPMKGVVVTRYERLTISPGSDRDADCRRAAEGLTDIQTVP